MGLLGTSEIPIRTATRGPGKFPFGQTGRYFGCEGRAEIAQVLLGQNANFPNFGRG